MVSVTLLRKGRLGEGRVPLKPKKNWNLPN